VRSSPTRRATRSSATRGSTCSSIPAIRARVSGRTRSGHLARFLIEDRGHHRLTIDPAAANERAIRAYEKVGFRKVGLLRRYQYYPDGTWQDGLLMELLAEEFLADDRGD
jgi:aminoglycoside 6'-N-acetyltransferase